MLLLLVREVVVRGVVIEMTCSLLGACFPRSGWYSFYVIAVGCVLLGVFISVIGELVLLSSSSSSGMFDRS